MLKNREGLVDFGIVMDIVCDDAHWNESIAHAHGCSMIIHSNVCCHKPHPLRHQNQPGFPEFSHVR